jgi:hypothetical protein
MKTELAEIQTSLQDAFKKHIPTLRVNKVTPQNFEVTGDIPAQYGKKMVDGYYFGSIVPKPKDIRFYFFPIYTHVKEFNISDEMKKCLKGKSCFHVKKLSPELEQEFNDMITKGVELYKKEGWI